MGVFNQQSTPTKDGDAADADKSAATAYIADQNAKRENKVVTVEEIIIAICLSRTMDYLTSFLADFLDEFRVRVRVLSFPLFMFPTDDDMKPAHATCMRRRRRPTNTHR